MEQSAATPLPAGRSQRSIRTLLALQLVALAVVAVVAVVGLQTVGLDRWSPLALAVLAGLALAGELTAVASAPRVYVSSGFLALVLAEVLLGPRPAAALGALVITVAWPRQRWSAATYVQNLFNYTVSPLAGGLCFVLLHSLTHLHRTQPAFYLLVFATYVVTLGVNLLIVAGHASWKQRAPMLPTAWQMLTPVLAAELVSALLTLGGVFVADRLGLIGLVLFGLALGIFQYLVSELLTSQRRSEQLQRVATTDELTGLANRERFHDAIEQQISSVEDGEDAFAIMLMDLDRFKEINDTLGHHYGDVLLRELGPRLVAAVGPDGLVARLGGDEFGILPGVAATADPRVIDVIADRLTATVAQAFTIDELSLEIGASVGVSRYPQDGADAHALLRCADIAMYAAKEAQTGYKLYRAEQNQHSVRRLNVLSDIRHALVSDEIVVHYQPIVDVDDRSVIGAEGLVRWQHPEHGLIPPAGFVQTVEQTGLIGPLTRHVLQHSIADCASWRREGRELSVAVNLSVRNLLDRDLPGEIERMLDAHGVPAHALQLEITESMIMTDPERALATVSRLSALGVRLSVDDFGTGYSSLANLRRLPIDELKIDRSFVSPMLRDESDLIIVRSTINLGHDLGLRIIAEGVEDAPTLERLAVLGCDLAQGYHLSRPMPASAFHSWLEDSHTAMQSGSPALHLAGASGPPARVGTHPASQLIVARQES